MNLSQLKYFTTLSKEKHFRKASEICYVSQPTLSIAIKKLEEELKITLFERRKNDVILTSVGKQILPLAEKILETTKNIESIAHDEKHQTSEIKIGVIYTIAPYLLPKLIQKIQQEANNIRIVIEEGYTDQLSKKLVSGEIDVMIASFPFSEPNIETAEIYEEPFMAAISKASDLNALDEVDLNTVSSEPIFLLGVGNCFRDQVIKAYPALSDSYHNLQTTLEGSSLETIKYMVATNSGMTVLPCSAVKMSHDDFLNYKPLKKPIPTRKVMLAWRNTFPRKKILNQFKEIIKTIEIPCTIH